MRTIERRPAAGRFKDHWLTTPGAHIAFGYIAWRMAGLLAYTASPYDYPASNGLLALGQGHMARITVEDCLENIDNIFEMVLVAAKRARRLAHGADAMVELENDKPTVIALREIAEGHITPAILEEIDQPAVDELMNPAEPAEDILPIRGISIGD